MNKNLLALLIASSLGLYGCGDETSLEGKATIDPDIEKSLKAETKINFDLMSDPSNPVIVMPTFLAMDSTDGTLSVDNSAADPSNLKDPQVALGKTDGWSTTQPITVEFTGNDLAETPAADSFYLIASKDPTNSADGTQPTILSAAQEDFVVITSGSTLTVILKKPLNPASNYMFAITDALKDSKGNSVGMSNSYAVLKSTNKPPSDALLPAQVIVQATEKELETVGVDTSDIIFSSWFTTASVGDVLYATKGAIASAASAISQGATANMVWKGSANPNDVDTTGMFSVSTPTNITAGLPGYTALGLNVYAGSVNIPYFLDTNVANDAWKKTPWQSGMPSLAKISNVLSTGSDADKAKVVGQLAALSITPADLAQVATDSAIQLKVLTALTGQTLLLADGSQLDPAREITRYSPVPQLKSMEPIPYLLVMPNMANCAGITTGVPVTIFQHGITSKKENVLALAPSTIASECQSLIAIDHPLHGARALSDGTITDEDNAQVYMNLEYLPVGRDNIRQSIADNISLRTALGLVFSRNSKSDPTVPAPFNVLSPVNGASTGVGFVGHSLGAISGIGYVATTNKAISTDEAVETALFKTNRAQFANPGAGIPYLLLNSTEFGGTVKDSLLSSASPEYLGFKSKFCPTGTTATACFTGFYSNLTDEQKTKTNATFAQFAYAAQTVLDTIDPINFISKVPTSTPTYLTMVVGDAVIPNSLSPETSAPYSPFGGTAPLIFSGFNQLVGSVDSPLREAATFSAGGHSSLLDPTDSAAVTTEMQAQTHSFIVDGKITVTDSSVLTQVTP